VASIIAQVDPVAAGYLIVDRQGRLRLPPLRRLADLPIQQSLPGEPNLLVEHVLHNLSDADTMKTFISSATTMLSFGALLLSPVQAANVPAWCPNSGARAREIEGPGAIWIG
jgi:hypothetical protein